MSQITFFPAPFFDRFEVCGRYIPSEESIDLILDEIGDYHNEIQFIESNNIGIALFEQSMCNPENNDDFSLRKLLIELIQNYHKQGEVVGEDATEFIQSLAVVNWFAAMVARMKEGNIQNLRKIFSSHHTYFKKDKIIELDKPEKNYTPRYSDLKKGFPEYAEATQFLTEWYVRVINLSSDKPELTKLMTRERLLIKQICENREKSTNPHLNKCCFCQNLFLSDGGGGHKTCGADECERRYSATTTKKNRSQPNALARRTKLAKAFNGIANFCDECKKRRVLWQSGDENFCKHCCQTVLKIW
jgi:hypothetical protein